MITFRWMIQSRRQSPDGGDEFDMQFNELMVEGHPVESYRYTATPTTHPIERGADTTDHVIDGLDIIEFELIVPRATKDPRINFDPDRPTTVIDTFRRLKSQAIPVDFETRRGQFEGFLISEVGEERTVENGDGARFNLSLQQLITSTLETVEAPSPSVERARPQRDRGQQNARNSGENASGDDSPENRDELRQSLAAGALDWMGW